MDKNGKFVTSYDTTGVSGSFTAEPVDKSNPKLLGASSENGGIRVLWTANIGTTTGSGNESVQATAGSTCSFIMPKIRREN